ncbi:InlB B-repeat-containing protein [Nocardioides panacisoli]|uniref:Ig-like domain repeat protein n=1 Tax=Nocardioides panacisoli TaxID=627624 RepID=A0ABP7IX84_9ACTN
MLERHLGARFARFRSALLAFGLGATLVGLVPSPATAATVDVGTFDALQLAFVCPPSDPGTVRMTADITAPSTALGVGCSEVVLDLAGHDLAVQSVFMVPGARLVVDDSVGGGSLTADASGQPNTAGIRTSLAELVVNGGTVVARGGAQAAGIGSAWPSSPLDLIFLDAGSTKINGGSVTATGGVDGSGIGGGLNGGGGTTVVNGGTVVATGGNGAPSQGLGAVGIGGWATANFSTVTITGGVVTAHGVGESPGVSSSGDPGGKVAITGGTVTATGNTPSAVAFPFGPGGPAIGGQPNMRLEMTGGTLRLPPSGWLYVPDTAGTEVTLGPDAVIDGTANASSTYGVIFGDGRIDNDGSIRLPTDRMIGLVGGQLPTPTVTRHNYTVSFDTQGGSPAPAAVRVFAANLTRGNRTLPPAPTRNGHVFVGWNTAADGSGDPVTATSTLPGSSTNGTPVPLTAYAQWEQLPVTVPEPTVSGTPEIGQLLTAHVGVTDPANATLAYQWYRVDRLGSTSVVPGANAATYQVSAADVGARLQVEVTASAPDYRSTTRTSAAIGPVPGEQRLAFTSTPPDPARVGGSYTPAAAGDTGSGNPIVISVAAAPHAPCSIDSTGVVHFEHVGTCELIAVVDGDENYPMAQAFQDIEVAKGRQTVTFTSGAPDPGAVGETYTPAATGGDSGAPVSFSVLPVPDGVAVACSVHDGVVTFEAAGRCELRADQAGTADYDAAEPAEQSITVIAKAATTTSVQVRPDRLIAEVHGDPAATPTGSVTFTVDGGAVGSGDLVPTGDGVARAVLPTVIPAGDSRHVQAAYSGDRFHAGSTASTTRTDPVVTATVQARHDRTRGWYRTPVRVVFDCTPGSATVDCPRPARRSQDGADQRVERTVTAADGGSASVHVVVSIDRTRPAVRATGVRDGATYDHFRRPVCVADDLLSGIHACTVKVDRSSGGDGLVLVSYRVRAVDVAGNRSTVRGTYFVRR